MAVHVDEGLNIFIDGKLVYLTTHVREEIDKYESDTLFVCEVVDKGERKLVSKNESRYDSRLAVGDVVWIVVWFDTEDAILIKHLGKEKR